MKANKLIIGSIATAIAVSVSSCSGDSIHLERSTTINAPIGFVWEHTNSLEAMNSWSPWMDKDPEMTSSMEGEDGTVGAKYSWSSEKDDVGVGSQSITDVAEYTIKTHLVFEGMGEADASVALQEKDGQTMATWSFDQETAFPVNIIMMFIDMEEQLGPDYEKGMANLKAMVEGKKGNKMEFGGHKIAKEDLGNRTFVGIKATVDMDDIGDFLAEKFGTIMMKTSKAGVELTGMPAGLYFTWDEENNQTEVMAAVPVEEGAEVEGLESFSISGNSIMIDFYGPYDASVSAHMAMAECMKWHGMEMNGPAVEIYANDPESVSDPSEINTKIYYPIK